MLVAAIYEKPRKFLSNFRGPLHKCCGVFIVCSLLKLEVESDT